MTNSTPITQETELLTELSPKEKAKQRGQLITQMIREGLTLTEIAVELQITIQTVYANLNSFYKKSGGVHSPHRARILGRAKINQKNASVERIQRADVAYREKHERDKSLNQMMLISKLRAEKTADEEALKAANLEHEKASKSLGSAKEKEASLKSSLTEAKARESLAIQQAEAANARVAELTESANNIADKAEKAYNEASEAKKALELAIERERIASEEANRLADCAKECETSLHNAIEAQKEATKNVDTVASKVTSLQEACASAEKNTQEATEQFQKATALVKELKEKVALATSNLACEQHKANTINATTPSKNSSEEEKTTHAKVNAIFKVLEQELSQPKSQKKNASTQSTVIHLIDTSFIRVRTDEYLRLIKHQIVAIPVFVEADMLHSRIDTYAKKVYFSNRKNTELVYSEEDTLYYSDTKTSKHTRGIVSYAIGFEQHGHDVVIHTNSREVEEFVRKQHSAHIFVDIRK